MFYCAKTDKNEFVNGFYFLFLPIFYLFIYIFILLLLYLHGIVLFRLFRIKLKCILVHLLFKY